MDSAFFETKIKQIQDHSGELLGFAAGTAFTGLSSMAYAKEIDEKVTLYFRDNSPKASTVARADIDKQIDNNKINSYADATMQAYTKTYNDVFKSTVMHGAWEEINGEGGVKYKKAPVLAVSEDLIHNEASRLFRSSLEGQEKMTILFDSSANLKISRSFVKDLSESYRLSEPRTVEILNSVGISRESRLTEGFNYLKTRPLKASSYALAAVGAGTAFAKAIQSSSILSLVSK